MQLALPRPMAASAGDSGGHHRSGFVRCKEDTPITTERKTRAHVNPESFVATRHCSRLIPVVFLIATTHIK
jgi:hypothetical protein